MIHYNEPPIYRITGRTTRQADAYIQQLFNSMGEWVCICDHYPGIRASEMLANKIYRRMEMEHRIKLDVCKKEGKPYVRIPLGVAKRFTELRNRQREEYDKYWKR